MAKILIAEDSADNAEILSEILEDEGYEYLVAHDVASVVRQAIAWRPDAILMDLEMPVSDSDPTLKRDAGLIATREIRAHATTSKTPIIALTGADIIAERERIESAGCTDVARKPYEFGKLLALIESVVTMP